MLCDFHLHTHQSDGIIPPTTLLGLVRRAGVDFFAVTDHDTLAGYAALRGSLGLVAGVELTSGLAGREIHLVALGIDPDHAPFTTLLADIRAIRLERLAVLTARLPPAVGRGLNLKAICTNPEFAHVSAFGRLHLAKMLVKLGGVASIHAAFADHLGDDYTVDAGLPAYPHPTICCAAIHAAGGVAILAHPGIYGTVERAAELIELGCDGLEISHPNLDPELASKLSGLAESRGLLASSGSDLHFPGARKPGAWSLPDARVLPLLQRLGLMD